MKRRYLARGIVLGSILWALLPIAPAEAAPAVHISTSDGQTVKGTFQVAFQITSNIGLKSVSVSVDQPNGSHHPGEFWSDGDSSWCARTDLNCHSAVTTYQNQAGLDTTVKTPYNGAYVVTVTAQDQDGSTSFDYINVDVNNPPKIPSLSSVQNTGTPESPHVTVSWTYDGTEPDLREFQIDRSGPDGHNPASVLASDPSLSGPCTVSGDTYTCDDSVFGSSGYGGTYTYKIWAMRVSPTGPDTSGQPGTCKLDSAGNPYSGNGKPCIGRSSSSQSATISEPPPTTGSGGSSGGGSGSVSGDEGLGSNGSSGFRKPPPGTHVLGQRQTQLPGDDGFFTSGSYNEKLPYQKRNLLSPYGTVPGTDGTREVASGPDRPLGLPLKDRSLLVPLAAGLLLTLGAAHVKRLLTDR